MCGTKRKVERHIYIDTIYSIINNISYVFTIGIIYKFFKKKLSQVQKIPNFPYQIYQTLQINWVYEKDYIKYKYDRKWKTENMAEKHNFQV